MVTPPGLEPGSTGCQTCALTATPKSQARGHGSQSSFVVTITSSHCPHLREAPPTLHAHKHSLRIHQPYFSHPERHTHKCFTHLWGPLHRGQPTWGFFTRFYGHTSPMTSRQAIPLLTPFVAKGESSHPTRP